MPQAVYNAYVTNATARKALEQAIQAGGKRNYAKAVELLSGLLAGLDSDEELFLPALLYLGRARQALGQLGPAIESFRLYLRAGGERSAGLFFLGRSYMAAGRHESAAACLRRSLSEEPRSAAAWALLGAALLKLKKTKDATEALEKAVGLAPDDQRVFRAYLNVLFARAVRLLAQGDADMARQMLDFVLERGLDGTALRLWKARALRELGRYEEALGDCEAALAFSPEDTSLRWLRAGLLLSLGRQSQALTEFEALRKKNPGLPSLPPDESALARLRASVAFRDGRWREAASEALALLRSSPKDAALRALAAESMRELGELERALNHWARAVEADPRSAELRLGLALALWDSGEYGEALRAVERARKLGAEPGEADYYEALCRSRLGDEPETLLPRLQQLMRARNASNAAPDPRLMFALGEALYRSARPELAAGWFEKVLRLAPEHELSLLYRISTAESLGDRKAEDKAYALYLETYPDNTKLRREYIELLVDLKQWDRAARQIEFGMRYAKPRKKTRRLLGLCYRNAGLFREAALVYRDLLRANPYSGELLVALAWCLWRDGKADYALALLDKAPARAKRGVEPWILQGLVLERMNRTEAAVNALKKACELSPGSARAWEELGLLYKRKGLSDFSARCLERAKKLSSHKR